MNADNTLQKPNRRVRRIANGVAFMTLALVIAGAIIRLTVRDLFPTTGLIFYVTPPAMMVILLLGVAVFLESCFVRTRRLSMLLLCVSVAWTVKSQWVFNRPITDAGRVSITQRLMFWNVCEGRYSWNRVLDTIRQHNPDVIALAEANLLKSRDSDFYEQHFPGYQRLSFPRRILLLSRLPIRSHRRLAWVRGCVVEGVEIETDSGVFTLVLSDVASNIFSHRKPQIEALTAAASGLSGPVIMAGDLNTPVESLFFDKLREDYISAFESRGQGLNTTWPLPVPVMAIDHMWGNHEIDFHDAHILWTTASDHRPIVCDFTVKKSHP